MNQHRQHPSGHPAAGQRTGPRIRMTSPASGQRQPASLQAVPASGAGTVRCVQDDSAAHRRLVDLGFPWAEHDFPHAPAILPGRMRREMSRGSRVVLAALSAVPDYFGSLAQLADFLGMNFIDPSIWSLCPFTDWAHIVRTDIVIQSGSAQLIEVNAASHAALFPVHDLVLEAQRALPDEGAASGNWRRGARNDHPGRALAASLPSCVPAGSAEGLVILAYPAGERAGPGFKDHHYRALAEMLARAGLRAEIVPLADLTFTDIDQVCYHDDRVALVYRFFEMAPDRLVSRSEAALIRAVSKGNVGLVTSPRGDVLSNKILLALIGEDDFQAGLPAHVRTGLHSYLAWTRRLREGYLPGGEHRRDLPRWVSENKNKLVLKRGYSFGGQRVIIGVDCSPSAWDAAINRGLGEKTWVVQRFCPPDAGVTEIIGAAGRQGKCQGATVYGGLLISRRFVGCMQRQLPSREAGHNVNGSSGAIPTPVVWV
jgi:hypothetical protein